MKYALNLGRLAAGKQQDRGGALRIAVLADLSGRANKGQVEIGEALAQRRPMKADVDNLDDLIGRMGLTLNLPLGDDGTAIEVEIGCMDDFHPDDLYDNLEVFSELSGLRRRLKSTSTFAQAAKEVSGWVPDQPVSHAARPRRSGGNAVPRGKFTDFAQLVGQPHEAATASSTDDLIQRVVAPHVVPSADPQQEVLVAAIDEALSAALRGVLHHPDFQAAESIWRSIDLLTRRIETSGTLQIVLYDITAEEIAADLSATDDLAETGLYSLLVEQPGMDAQQGALSVLVGNYLFEQTPPHADLLARMAKIAAAANAPFIAGISAASVEKNAKDAHPLVAESWAALRNLPEAVYLGLTVPRYLLRWPYGAKTEPIDPFEFEEFTPQTGLKGMLWGNGAILTGLLLAETYQQQGMGAMKLGAVTAVDDMPFYYYTDKHGDQVALPCTERALTERNALQLKASGLMPILSMRGRPEVRLGGFESVAGALLAGPWAPVSIDAPAEESAADEPIEEAVSAAAAVDDVDEDSVTDAPVDDDTSAAEADDASASEGDDDDDDLDALLASLDDDDDENESGDDDDDMDPELAALLDGL